MPTFRYQAFLKNGKKITGHINADDISDAKQKLLKNEFLLTKIDPLILRKKTFRFKKSDLLLFTKELSRLLQAGLPLFESLIALEEKYRNHSCHPILLDLADRVKQGISFSDALKKHPESFDLVYLCMIENAERSGNIEDALNEMATFITRQLTVKKQLINALLYPCLLTTFCLVVLGTLFFFVIPSLAELFEGRALHPFTAFILALSKKLIALKLYLILFGIGTIAFLLWSFISQKGKNYLHILGMHLPLSKSLLIKLGLIRFCRSTGAMLLAGVPFLESLKLSRRVLHHPELEKVVAGAEQRVLEGEKISENLKQSTLIPPLVTRMLGIAEEGGNIPLMLKHIAQIYEEEMEKNLTHLTQIAQPVLLLFIGAIVGLVLLSVLLPLTDVSSFLDN